MRRAALPGPVCGARPASVRELDVGERPVDEHHRAGAKRHVTDRTGKSLVGTGAFLCDPLRRRIAGDAAGLFPDGSPWPGAGGAVDMFPGGPSCRGVRTAAVDAPRLASCNRAVSGADAGAWDRRAPCVPARSTWRSGCASGRIAQSGHRPASRTRGRIRARRCRHVGRMYRMCLPRPPRRKAAPYRPRRLRRNDLWPPRIRTRPAADARPIAVSIASTSGRRQSCAAQ